MTRTPTDYSKSVIYKLCCKDPTIEDIYIGSTTNFTKRKYQHKNGCNNENNKKYNCYKYQFIRDNGGFNNWDMILIKDYSTDTKRNLEIEERRIIDELKPSLNKNIPTRTKKEYIEINKDKRTIYQKEWRKTNKVYFKEYQTQYYDKNREKKLEQQKEYREKNKETLIEYNRNYYQKYKEREKITCGKCGAIVSQYCLKRHQRTPKCINYN